MAKKNKLKPQYIILDQVPVDYYENGIKTNFFQSLWHNHKHSLFKRWVKNQDFKRIIDIGCASGFMTNLISEVFSDSKIHGIDAYKKAISYAKKKYPHINFAVAKAEKLPFDPSYFDLIVCYETIEHLENPSQALKEIRRVLNKTGLAVVAMDSGNFLFRMVWWVWEKTRGKVWQGSHIHPFHHFELEELIKKA